MNVNFLYKKNYMNTVRFVLMLILCIVSINAQDNIFEGASDLFITDINPPEVELYSPLGGETFNGGEVINVEWSTIDDSSFPDDAVDVLLSTTIVPYDFQPIAEGLLNTGYSEVELPYVDTYLGRIRVLVRDSFGNAGHAEHSGYLSIGDSPFQDTTIVIQGITTNFITDIIPPDSIQWIYPNGEEEFNVGVLGNSSAFCPESL